MSQYICMSQSFGFLTWWSPLFLLLTTSSNLTFLSDSSWLSGHRASSYCSISFASQRRSIFHTSSSQLPPHPPPQHTYLSTFPSQEILEKHIVLRFSYLFTQQHLLSFEFLHLWSSPAFKFWISYFIPSDILLIQVFFLAEPYFSWLSHIHLSIFWGVKRPNFF